MRSTILATLSLLTLVSCQEASPEKVGPYTLLSPRERLIRLSVDLRGVHPTEEDLVAISENPDLYEDFVDRWMDDPRFVARMGEVFNERFLTRTADSYGVSVEGVDGTVVAEAIGNEPIKLVERIVRDDLPWSEIVTADYTMANPVLARAYNLEYPSGQTGWEMAHYKDGREHAGILTMSTTWLRYPSMGGNANRSRANAVSRMLLCDDYLNRPLVLNRAAVDQLTISPEDAIATNVSCQSCHSTLDPIASHFFGFFIYDDQEFTENPLVYRPEREEAWREFSNRAPGWYGTPTANIREMAALIAEDQRFSDCAVQTVVESFNQRTFLDEDWEELMAHQDAFEAEGLRIRPLVRSVVTSPAYMAGSVDDEILAERVSTVRMASPAQLTAIVEDITGYRWEFGGQDLLTDPNRGVPVLLGGIDGRTARARNYSASVGTLFTQERLSWNAAWHVVTTDFAIANGEERRLLKYVQADQGPDEAPDRFEAQVRFLYNRVTGKPLPEKATEVEDIGELWRQVRSIEGSPEKAWAAVVSVILRDPSVIYY